MANARRHGFFMGEVNIRAMMQHVGAGVTLDVMSHEQGMAAQHKSAETLMALAVLCKTPEGMRRSEQTAYRIIQLCAVGYSEAEILQPNAYLHRYTLGVREAWPSISPATKERVGAAAWGPYITGNPDAIPAVQPRDITALELTNLAVAMGAEPGMMDLAICSFTSGLLAICKQGTVTTNVCNKISRALQEANNIRYNPEPDVIAQVWRSLSSWFVPQSAEHFFALWENTIGESCLRLRLLISQANWVGMTNYNNIKEARRTFPTFPWHQAHLLIPRDFNNYRVAVGLVGNNQYYGYNRDLGDAKSTLYPSLSFLARELLIEAAGKRDLAAFQGITNNVPRAAELQEMVRTFVAERRVAFEPEVIEAQRANQDYMAWNNLFVEQPAPNAAGGRA